MTLGADLDLSMEKSSLNLPGHPYSRFWTHTGCASLPNALNLIKFSFNFQEASELRGFIPLVKAFIAQLSGTIESSSLVESGLSTLDCGNHWFSRAGLCYDLATHISTFSIISIAFIIKLVHIIGNLFLIALQIKLSMRKTIVTTIVGSFFLNGKLTSQPKRNLFIVLGQTVVSLITIQLLVSVGHDICGDVGGI
ncbi:hypothetical protein HAX54_051647 [Datura stramonium]|uniref:Uncharacterized protein n=1 Tax=Datura stramonium TaxID=4076 RepID=A0ABS8SXW7_DATST|nr:hypothetical protein [Datura stramonium]